MGCNLQSRLSAQYIFLHAYVSSILSIAHPHRRCACREGEGKTIERERVEGSERCLAPRKQWTDEMKQIWLGETGEESVEQHADPQGNNRIESTRAATDGQTRACIPFSCQKYTPPHSPWPPPPKGARRARIRSPCLSRFFIYLSTSFLAVAKVFLWVAAAGLTRVPPE